MQVCKTHVASVIFADYGSITGDCTHGLSISKCHEDLRLAVAKACVGHPSCDLSCVQGGANRCTVNGQLIVPSPDPCDGVGKKIALQITGAAAEDAEDLIRPGCDPTVSYCNDTLPSFVTSVTNAYMRGKGRLFCLRAQCSLSSHNHTISPSVPASLRENSDGKGTRCICSIFAMRASVPIQNIVLDLALLANVKSSNFMNEYGQSMHVLYNLDWYGCSHRKNRTNAASALPI